MSIDFQSVFAYNEDSPSGLVWNMCIMTGRYLTAVAKSVGDFAGCASVDYWQVTYKNRTYKCHRVIYEILYGEVEDGFCVDHIDGNSFNNKVENLRKIPQCQNNRNTRKRVTNKSGVTGVCLRNFREKLYWTATWRDVDGKAKGKQFNIDVYGSEQAFKLACEYRKMKIDELNSNGQGFSSRHGL